MGISLYEKVDVIRQDSDLNDLPVLFSSDFGDDLAKASGNSTLEYLGSPIPSTVEKVFAYTFFDG